MNPEASLHLQKGRFQFFGKTQGRKVVPADADEDPLRAEFFLRVGQSRQTGIQGMTLSAEVFPDMVAELQIRTVIGRSVKSGNSEKFSVVFPEQPPQTVSEQRILVFHVGSEVFRICKLHL